MTYTNKQDLVASAMILAASQHGGQKDKQGKPYVLHLIRVASSFADYGDIDCTVVALLHDILEDTDCPVEFIETQFGPRIADAVRALTRPKGMTHEAYMDQVIKNPLAVTVKRADLDHNIDRWDELPEGPTKERLAIKYNYFMLRLSGWESHALS